jgi:hypothetical protein
MNAGSLMIFRTMSLRSVIAGFAVSRMQDVPPVFCRKHRPFTFLQLADKHRQETLVVGEDGRHAPYFNRGASVELPASSWWHFLHFKCTFRVYDLPI